MGRILYQQIDGNHLADYGITDEPAVTKRLNFRRGEKITEELPNPLVFKVNHPDDQPPPHILSGVVPVMSGRLIGVFREAGIIGFQEFPAVLENPKTGTRWDGYFAFNWVGEPLQAADLKKSEYDTIMGGRGEGGPPPLLAFEKIVLSKKKLGGEPLMFRMAESPGSLLIHDSVYKLLEKRSPGRWGLECTDVEVV